MPYDDLPDDYFDEYGRPPVLNQHDYAEGMPDSVRDEVAREEAAARMSLALDSMAAGAAEDERRAAAARAASPVAREMDRGIPPRAAGGVVVSGGGAHPGGLRVPGTIPGYYWESTPAPHPIWLDGTIMNPISTEQFLMYPYMNMFNQRMAAAPAAPAPKRGGGAPVRGGAPAPVVDSAPAAAPGPAPAPDPVAEPFFDRETAITTNQVQRLKTALDLGAMPGENGEPIPLSPSQRRNFQKILDSARAGRGATEWTGVRGNDLQQGITDYLYGGLQGKASSPLGAANYVLSHRYDTPAPNAPKRTVVRPEQPVIYQSGLVYTLGGGR